MSMNEFQNMLKIVKLKVEAAEQLLENAEDAGKILTPEEMGILRVWLQIESNIVEQGNVYMAGILT